MSSAALTVALELAKERFGSTLNIKGTAEFKQQVIDVVAKNGLDIHFTSKEMNRQLEERKAELATERDGQAIEQPVLFRKMHQCLRILLPLRPPQNNRMKQMPVIRIRTASPLMLMCR